MRNRTRGGVRNPLPQWQIPFAATVLALLLGAGILLSFLIPPFQVPDEPVHWGVALRRSEEILSLRNLPDKRCGPAYAIALHFENGRIAFRPWEKFSARLYEQLPNAQPSCLDTTMNYGSFLTYPAVFVARILTPDSLSSAQGATRVFHLARILSGIFVLLAALRVLVLARASGHLSLGIFSVLAFLGCPLVLQQSFSINADTVSYLFCLLAGAHYLSRGSLTWLDRLLFLLLAAVVAGTKPPLLPIVLAHCVVLSTLPAPRKLPVLSFYFAVALCSTALAIFTYVNVTTASGSVAPPFAVDPKAQIAGLMAEPIKGITMLTKSIFAYADPGPLISPLGWLDTPLSYSTKLAWGIAFCIAVAIDFLLLLPALGYSRAEAPAVSVELKRYAIMLAQSGILVLAALGSAYGIAVALYMNWTPVGADGVLGLQGRYFHPSLLTLWAAFLVLFVPQGQGESPGAIAPAKPVSRGYVALLVFAVSAFAFLYLRYLTLLYEDVLTRYWS